MKPRLKLEVCAFFADEFRAALAADGRGDIELAPIHGACDERRRPAHTEDPPAPSDVPLLRLMCVCSGLVACPKSPHSCFEYLLGPDKVDALLGKGAHLLTPAMVRAYPEALQSLNETPESLHASFAESVRAWVVVDTRVAPLTAAEQAAFLAATGGRMELFHTELHLLRANLRAAIAQWEVTTINARSAGQIALLQHRLADYTMAYDLIGRLIPHQGEQTIIQAILELFYMLCAPRAVHLLLVQGGGKDGDTNIVEESAQLFSLPADSGKEDDLRAFLRCPVPRGEIEPPQQGFYFQIHQDEHTLGVVVVEGSFLAEHQHNYLDLALLLMPILRLALHNARSYERLSSTERELRASQMELEQRVDERTRELRESERRLKEAQRISQLGSWELDIVKNKLAWSDEVFRLFEIDQGKFPATYEGFLDAIHPDDRDAVNSAYAHSLKTREPYEITHRLLMCDGRIKWVTERCTSYFDPESKPVRSVGTVQDITEHKRVEKELRGKSQLLDSIVENIPNMIFLKRASDLSFELFNRAGEALVGHGRDELLGRNDYDFFPKEQADFFTGKDRATLEQDGIVDIPEESIETPCGTRILHTRKLALRDEHGRPQYLLGISEDITERKYAEEKLRSLSIAIEQSPLSVVITDLDAKIQYANPCFLKTTGYSMEEAIGQNPRILQSGQTPKETYVELWKALSNGQVWRGEFINKRKNGELYWEEAHIAPVLNTAGAPMLYVAVKLEITQRKEFEEELKRSNAELEQFSYAVSHDMRQPLRMISSYLQLIEMSLADQLDSEKRGYFNFAIEGAKRIDQMLVALLEYSRVGRRGEPPMWAESRAILDEALQYLQPAITEAQAQLNIAGEWPRIFASPDEILRLLQNLIGNAVKFRVAGRTPEITVTSKLVKNEWHLCIADNGVGIIPGQIKRLFQVFQRLQSRDAYEGTGIGLALCRKIAEHHKGRIWAESAGEGLGSKFWVVLPVPHENRKEGTT